MITSNQKEYHGPIHSDSSATNKTRESLPRSESYWDDFVSGMKSAGNGKLFI